jgi:two-component system sensor histidine kinase PilS (NtrC family)
LILAGALLLITLTDNIVTQAHGIDVELLNAIVGFYTFIVIFGNIACYVEWPEYNKQVYLHTITDITALLLIIHASGGVSFGLGILLVLPVIIPNLLHPGQFSLLLAAITIVVLLAIEASIQLQGKILVSEISRTGILAFFIMLASWLASSWSLKSRETAALARQRGLDIANLSQLNQSILDQLQTGILVLHDSRKIRHMNTAAKEILGNPTNWTNQPLKNFAPELDAWFQYWNDNQRPNIFSYDVKHQGVTELRARFIQLGTVANGTSLIYLEDTHEEREHLQDMKLASLGQLTANIAHEIRNPLGAISHAAQLLSEPNDLDPETDRLMQIIQSNCKRMDLTIESVLNLSRRKTPTRETMRLKLWLKDFFDDFLPQTGLTPSQLSLFIEPADIQVRFDPAHLHQVLWNLCNNAVKYAKDDRSKLHLLIQGGIPNHARDTVLNIIDNGKGVPEEDQEHLFEPFFTTSTKGTGLGLFMSREICQANGASLEYVRLSSGGSCFRISFTKECS